MRGAVAEPYPTGGSVSKRLLPSLAPSQPALALLPGGHGIGTPVELGEVMNLGCSSRWAAEAGPPRVEKLCREGS